MPASATTPSRLPDLALRGVGTLLGAGLVMLLVVPLLVLVFRGTPAAIGTGLASPAFWPALALSLRTTVVSLAVVVLTGTPLAWWLSRAEGRLARVVGVLVDLPIVIPPPVVGVALLLTFGISGVFGRALIGLGVQIPFSTAAVILAQVVVAAPFFVQASASGFREVDRDQLLVARTLGASPSQAFFRVALPVARPSLIAGASLAWARALGEFGATLLFAGNKTAVTQTMPLAIRQALESDVEVAIMMSLVLVAAGALLLASLRLLGRDPRRERRDPP